MAEVKFKVGEVPFRLFMRVGGVQELCFGETQLSRVRALGARAEHSFTHAGDAYEVGVQSDLFGPRVNVRKNGQGVETDLVSLSGAAGLMCGWPLVMVAFGGAIGGGLGGAAAAANLAIYKSGLPTWAKVVLNLTCGGLAFLAWLAIGVAIASQR